MGGRYSPQHSADLLNATGPGSYTADLSPVRRSSSAYSFGRSMQRAQEGRKAVPGPGEYDISAAMRHVRPSTSATTISELSRPAPGDSSGGPGPGAYQPRIEAASTHRSSFIGAPMSSGARDGSMGKADITPAPADYDLSRSLRQSHKNAAAFTIGSGRKADRAAGRMPGVGTYDITKADGQLHSSSASVGMPHSVRGAGDHSDRTPAPNQYDPQDMSPRKGGVSMKWRYRTKGESQPGPTDYVSPYLPRGRSAPAFTMRVKPRRGGTMGDALATPGPGAYDVGAATIGVYDLQY